jgi:uncharacterized protein YjbI with pentapeptide repeats
MSGPAPATAMPQHVAIRVDVGGTVFRISLHTLMEGARFSGVVFQALCLQILGPTGGGSAWDQRVVPAQNPQYGVKHFVDADPTPWPCWLEYLRTRRVPFVEAGPLRDRVICDSELAGLAELAEGLGQLAYWRRHELQALLVRPGGVYQGARLRGQDLSNLGFARCSLRRADLSDCMLTDCTFDGADMVGANLQRAVMTRSSLPRADLRKACLSGARLAGADLSDANLSNTDLSDCDLSGCNLAGATLPPWSSGLMEGVKLAGATGWVPADRNMRQANLKGGDLSGADLKRANLSDADLSGAKLIGADLSGCNLAGATLPPWSSGLMEGVKLAGATGWVPADRNMRQAKLKGGDLSGTDLKGVNLSDADLSGAKLIGADLSGCNLADATLPPWSSGLMEGVKLAGATGWMPADRNMRQARLKGAVLESADLQAVRLSNADLSGADLKRANLSDADLSGAKLIGADLSGCNLAGATLPPWSSGLMEGVKLAGATGWVPADRDMRKAKLKGVVLESADLQAVSLRNADLSGADLKRANRSDADLSGAKLIGVDLSGCKLAGATLPPWSSGLLEGVKVAGATGWVPADRNMRQVKLKGVDLRNADLSNCNLSGADLHSADLTAAELSGADLCGAMLAGARGGRAARVVVYSRPVNRFFSFGAATVQVQLGGGNSLMQVLKVGSPVVVALTAARALRLRSVAVVNEYYDRSQPGDGKHCAKRMEVLTGPAADGPWTSVATFTSAKTKDRQTFAAAPDSPALGGFVQVLVHDTHGDETCVRDVSLEGEAWGPAG